MVCVTGSAVSPTVAGVAVIGTGLALPRERITVIVRRTVLAATVIEEVVL